LSPLLRTVLGDQAPLALRERNIAFVLKGAAAIAEVLDGAFCFEAVTVRLVNRIACDPKLITRHACSTAATTAATATAIGVAAHRAFLLRDLSDAPALGRSKWDGAFIVYVAAPISEKIYCPLSFETVRLILFLTLRPLRRHVLAHHRRVLGPRHCIDVAGVANCAINVAVQPSVVLRPVPAILPEPVKVAGNISALRGVAEKLAGVAGRILAVLLDVSCVASNSVRVVRTGDRRERDCRSNGHCGES
jgi:hypothetical protein